MWGTIDNMGDNGRRPQSNRRQQRQRRPLLLQSRMIRWSSCGKRLLSRRSDSLFVPLLFSVVWFGGTVLNLYHPLPGSPLYDDESFKLSFIARGKNSPNVSVIIMNHGRPMMLLQSTLLVVLGNHPSVTDIIICHSNRNTMFNNSHVREQQQIVDRKNNVLHREKTLGKTNMRQAAGVADTTAPWKKITLSDEYIVSKIRHVDAIQMNERYGLALRFHYCSHQAKNQWVIVVDDDMEISSTAITLLIQYMVQESKRIVGYYGRTYNYYKRPLRHGYDTKLYVGQTVEVILTKLLIVDRVVCTHFFNYTGLVEDDLVLPYSKPKWNGEDIFLNLVSNLYYHAPQGGPYTNYAIRHYEQQQNKLVVWEADSKLIEYQDPEYIINTTSTQQNHNIDSTRTYPALQELYTRINNKTVHNSITSVSGNIDRITIWDSGPLAVVNAILKAMQHSYYRGKLWYTAKQRLYATTARNNVTHYHLKSSI
jgi:Glycosyl transferase family 64 domain